MEPPGKRVYRAKEFATRAGVSVRTLHHYDAVGLLSPAERSQAGYRLYDASDLERLEQILALRFIGLDLDHIKTLLDGSSPPLLLALGAQREIMRHAQRNLQSAIDAIDEAERTLERGGEDARWMAVQSLIEAFKMQNDHSWTEKYYSPEALEKLAEMRRTIAPATIQQAENAWSQLIAEVEEAATQLSPASDRARELAARWRDLIAQFTQGDAQVHDGLNKLYSDPQGWPAAFKRPWSDAADAFIKAAMKA